MYSFKNKDSYNIKEAYIELGLEMGRDFAKESNKVIKEYWNGVGRKGAWYNKVVPYSILGLDMSIISADHDYGYTVYRSLRDKKLTDDRFGRNGYKYIKDHSNFFTVYLRLAIMKIWYGAVKYLGFTAYMKGKKITDKDLISEAEKHKNIKFSPLKAVLK